MLEDLRSYLTKCKHENGASMGHVERLHAPCHGYAERLTPGTSFPGEPLAFITQHQAHPGCPCEQPQHSAEPQGYRSTADHLQDESML